MWYLCPFPLLYMLVVFIVGYYVTKFCFSDLRPLTRLAPISISPILNVISETIPEIQNLEHLKKKFFMKKKL